MQKTLKIVTSILLLFLFILLIIIPLDSDKQFLLGGVLIVFTFFIGIFKNKKLQLALILISLLCTSRYIWWRATTTLYFDSYIELILGSLLFIAELYSLAILLFGYIQTCWPLKRTIAPLPKDTSLWPTVDLFIPTYNESIDIVKDTALAAQCIEYPKDKLKIYILDDGKRDAFRQLAEDIQVGYMIRPDNNHAKAGNLNHALTKTHGELICIFDCDHVATRVFLQATVGAFLVDEKLALIQTPHYFYSKDPFERNLSAAKRAPHEGALFYGPVQQGNDNWNAAFFCGSCAVIRRSALKETNGFAVETVTEDAHTALKLQRKGWNTAFLDIPLSAGLATERLTLHINQRIRWARGMTQIFRVDNPLLGKGLTFTQRICYLNAMLHFQYGLPRAIFLLSPLVFILFDLNIISSSATLIFSYALPHLITSNYVNSKLVGSYRYSFWGEIYETVMAFHLILPTLMSLISPKLGKFNVTDKGDLTDKNYFDHTAVRPLLIVAVLLVAAIGIALFKWIMGLYHYIDDGVIVINLIWGIYSLLIVLASISVAKETKQLRRATRVPASIPVTVYFSDNSVIETQSIDLSMSGARLNFPFEHNVTQTFITQIAIGIGKERAFIPIQQAWIDNKQLRMEFAHLTHAIRRDVVRVVLTRADAWFKPKHANDKPLRSFIDVLQCAFELFIIRKDKKATDNSILLSKQNSKEQHHV
ncbi:UDP-forming cellulose synthase catalytic subunit [Providencia stuartii]|uniref:Cellulose synthase catalytic subunit [UDP-forming] n=2 Tax=Providencia stuartii TaxID=588 RepID=A0A140NKJ8_PROSM|nr:MULTISPECIES: UDP-forming cellulose synthase catalytic subunit [Providencia]AFH93167.1 cellulose synthase catalytic subunit [Providencia stuartii MRSN 2154]MDE8746596.1 UDP-forming cellulose synthase catalytic subunit [Providencia thailandensis]MDE8765351.1 UDP-forming cellulose synthase catalytic subunit [Providencia thailandensis]MDE8777651.1 UDP-forming cellulose synthase catalytic subunit [Providencia thailandensis]MDE8781640.1 UDP-forming cellulose synthase catalytic subunit [Providenc